MPAQSIHSVHGIITNKSTRSERKVVLVLTGRALRDPEDESGEHEQQVLRDVRISVVVELLRVVVESVLDH